MRMWIDKESSAFQALSSLVLNQRLLEDLDHVALFKHTGENRFAFTLEYDSMS